MPKRPIQKLGDGLLLSVARSGWEERVAELAVTARSDAELPRDVELLQLRMGKFVVAQIVVGKTFFSHLRKDSNPVLAKTQGKLLTTRGSASTVSQVLRKKAVTASPNELRAFRERLEELADRAGRKAVFAPAGVSEANFSRILGRGKKPIDNPGIFTIKALAWSAGTTVGYLLGEQGFDVSGDDRTRMQEFTRWLTERYELELPASSYSVDALPSSNVINFPMEFRESSQEAYVFPIPPDQFIQKDFDYPRPLHVWVVPEIRDAAAGPRAVDPRFPLQTAEVLHSIRDVYNNLLQVVRVIGDSMADVLRDGYKVLVDTTLNRPGNGDIVAVYMKDEGSLLGYWNKQADRYSLTKENQNYSRVDLGEPGEWLLLGTVTKIVEATVERRIK